VVGVVKLGIELKRWRGFATNSSIDRSNQSHAFII
jgi:hypothetical protein